MILTETIHATTNNSTCQNDIHYEILTHIWEVIMLGYAKIFKEKVYAEGKAEVYRELVAWEKRRRETEARGEKFTEPLPIPKPEESENTDNK